MLRQYFALKESIDSRARLIGEMLRRAKHPAAMAVAVPMFAAEFADIDEETNTVLVRIGYESTINSYTVIGVPYAVFEAESPDTVIQWINAEKRAIADAEFAATSEGHKMAEMKEREVLEQLKEKYESTRTDPATV